MIRYIIILIPIFICSCTFTRNRQKLDIHISGLPLPVLGNLVSVGLTIENEQNIGDVPVVRSAKKVKQNKNISKLKNNANKSKIKIRGDPKRSKKKSSTLFPILIIVLGYLFFRRKK